MNLLVDGLRQNECSPILIEWQYQQPRTTETYRAPAPQTVSPFARLVETLSLTGTIIGSRCTTKHRLSFPDRSVPRTPKVRRREGKRKGDPGGQRQSESQFRRTFARRRRLELGTDEGPLCLGIARGVPPQTSREVYKSRDGFRRRSQIH